MQAARPTACPCSAPRRQRGIALVLVLWLTILLMVIAGGFAFSMRSEAMSARNALSLAQVRAVTDGAVELLSTTFTPRRASAMTTAWSRD